MKTEYYKMEYEAWDEGTDELPLELEAAYLRVCHQMYRRRGPIPNQTATLARIWRVHPNKARKLLADLLAAGKIVVTPDGDLTNSRVTHELDRRETISKQRAAAGHTGGTQRRDSSDTPPTQGGGVRGDISQKPLKSNDAGSPFACDLPEQKPDSREEETRGEGNKKDSRAVADATRPRLDFVALFERFRAAYPKRDGANPRKPAFDKFVRLLKSGIDLDAIIGGAGRYADECRRKQIVGTEKVAQAITWLNQNRWEDYPAAGAGGAGVAEQIIATAHGARIGEKFYAMRETPQFEAWDAYLKQTKGRGATADARGGWWFDSEYPPNPHPISPDPSQPLH